LSLFGSELLVAFGMDEDFVVEGVRSALSTSHNVMLMNVFFVEKAFSTYWTYPLLTLGKFANGRFEGVGFGEFAF
jgi:hypothetical protein